MIETGKVFLIDDDESLLNALSRRLKCAGFETEMFRSPAYFLKRTAYSGPACILLDLMMPQMNGLEFQQTLHTYGISLPVIFLTGQGTVPAASAAFKAGAKDFLMKPVHSEELVTAVSCAIARHANILVAEENARSIHTRYNRLTPREREVCALLAQGLLNKQIGYSLDASESTIKKHRARVLEKLAVQSIVELVNTLGLMKYRPGAI